MSIQQISVFLDNTNGQIAAVTRLMAEKNINLRALSIADSHDFGILRLIVENPEETAEQLKAAGYTVTLTKVIAVEIADKPGSLAEILTVLSDANIGIEYTYAFVTAHAGLAYMILRVDNRSVAADVLEKAGYRVAKQSDIFQ